jgi:hypothetical protein
MAWKAQRGLERTGVLYSLVAVGGALMVGRLAHGMVDHYWSRGGTMLAWAGVGMAVGVYLAMRRQGSPDRDPGLRF